jgi:virginiamycin B lyase
MNKVSHSYGKSAAGFRRHLQLTFALTLALSGASQSMADTACLSLVSTPSPKSEPLRITKGPDGNLWFTEPRSNQVCRIDTGMTITEFPVTTTDSKPDGVAAGPDGNVWFTENGAQQIGQMTPAGKVLNEYRCPHPAPAGITAGPDGNLWFTEENGAIGRITTSGAVNDYVLPNAPDSPDPFNITTGPDGNLWFTERDASIIGRITINGDITSFVVPSGNSAGDITVGPDGNLWFTEFGANQIGRITTSGFVSEYGHLTPASGPFFITAGPDGNLWFTEENVNQIGRMTPEGTLLEEFPLPVVAAGPQPFGITAGPDGNLWFTDSGSSDIGRLAPPLTLAGCPQDQTVHASSCAGAVVAYSAPIAKGGCAPVTLTCTPPPGSTFPPGQTTVTCTAEDVVGTTASCSFIVTVVASADLAISLDAARDHGSTVTYTVTVTNAGPTLSCGVVVADTLPSGTTFANATTSQGTLVTPASGGTGTVTADLGTLAPDGTAVVTFDVNVQARGNAALVNTATVSATTPDPNPVNNSETLTSYFFGGKK